MTVSDRGSITKIDVSEGADLIFKFFNPPKRINKVVKLKLKPPVAPVRSPPRRAASRSFSNVPSPPAAFEEERRPPSSDSDRSASPSEDGDDIDDENEEETAGLTVLQVVPRDWLPAKLFVNPPTILLSDIVLKVDTLPGTHHWRRQLQPYIKRGIFIPPKDVFTTVAVSPTCPS